MKINVPIIPITYNMTSVNQKIPSLPTSKKVELFVSQEQVSELKDALICKNKQMIELKLIPKNYSTFLMKYSASTVLGKKENFFEDARANKIGREKCTSIYY